MFGRNNITGFAIYLSALFLSVLTSATAYDSEVQFYTTELLTKPVELTYEASIHSNRPQISGINATSYAWYWYGAQSCDLNQTTAIILDLGQESPPSGSIVRRAKVFGTFPNRNQWSYSLNASNGATIHSSEDGNQIGAWEGTGTYTSNAYRTSYKILLNTADIKGNVQLEPISHAQTSCNVWEEGVDTTWMPGFVLD